MLDAGGDAMLGVGNDVKWLPLHFAAEFLKSADGPAVVELLLARGPPGSATSKNNYGRTPLACAEQRLDLSMSPVAEEIAALLRAATPPPKFCAGCGLATGGILFCAGCGMKQT
jgi:hypothetical protein